MIMQPLATGGGGGTQHAAGDFSGASGKSVKITTGFKPTSLTIACSSINYSSGTRNFGYSYNNGTIYISDVNSPGSGYFTIALNDDGFTLTSIYSITSIVGGYTAFK